MKDRPTEIGQSTKREHQQESSTSTSETATIRVVHMEKIMHVTVRKQAIALIEGFECNRDLSTTSR